MKNQAASIIDFWKESYSKKINQHDPFKNAEQLIQIANVFAPGMTYYYVLNLNNYSIDYISPSVETVLGIKPQEATVKNLLDVALEIESLNKKEIIIQHFLLSFLQKKDILNYKMIYTYKCKTRTGKINKMLLQVSVIKLSNNGFPLHAIIIHTDISHLKSTNSDCVSFIHLNGGTSYYNIKTDKDYFCPENSIAQVPDWIETITKREKEIIQHLAKGESTKTIANLLHISTETVKTHRRNIALKSGSNNTVELISQCINAGVVM